MFINLKLPFGSDFVVALDGTELELTDAMQSGAMLANRSKRDSYGASKVVSVRMDLELVGFLDFIVERANGNFSRNELIIQLIRSGLAASWAEMSSIEQDRLLDDLDGKRIELEFPNEKNQGADDVCS